MLDPRPPTGFYGSELLAQAALQWAPAYCLDKSRFKFQLNQMSDAAAHATITLAQSTAMLNDERAKGNFNTDEKIA